MVTSKSTVLGLRLDHDRRAWVEAEAARRGVSVRVLFEGLIDEAQADETRVGANAAGDADSDVGHAMDDRLADTLKFTPDTDAPPAGGGNGAWTAPAAGLSLLPDIGSVAALPARLIRGAFAMPINLIKTSGRCAQKSVEGCAVLRNWGGRSA
jgi:hypothetical protein